MRTLLALLGRIVRVFARAVLFSVSFIVVLLIGTYLIIYTHFDGTATLPADCGIVFGAAVYGQNLPGPAISRRVAAAAELWREGSVKTLILSGGRGEGVRNSEAEVMRALALELGVAGDSLLIEEQSHSTWENLINSKNLTSGCSSVVGISDQYHLARIELLAWRQGWPELQTVPAQDRPPVESEKRSVFREVLAYLYYALYIDHFLPNLPEQTL